MADQGEPMPAESGSGVDQYATTLGGARRRRRRTMRSVKMGGRRPRASRRGGSRRKGSRRRGTRRRR